MSIVVPLVVAVSSLVSGVRSNCILRNFTIQLPFPEQKKGKNKKKPKLTVWPALERKSNRNWSSILGVLHTMYKERSFSVLKSFDITRIIVEYLFYPKPYPQKRFKHLTENYRKFTLKWEFLWESCRNNTFLIYCDYGSFRNLGKKYYPHGS